MLRMELRKIDARKREREKKTADLQKLIAQADTASPVEVSHENIIHRGLNSSGLLAMALGLLF